MSARKQSGWTFRLEVFQQCARGAGVKRFGKNLEKGLREMAKHFDRFAASVNFGFRPGIDRGQLPFFREFDAVGK